MRLPSPFGHRLRWVTVTALLLAGAALASEQRIELPDIGASARGALSTQREQALGEAFVRALRNELPLVEDPEVQSYIEGLGQRIARHSGDPGLRFHFFVTRDPSINAFAGPGGYIVVNSGLFLAAESESELAAVLAHEAAHVTQGHIARRIELADRMMIPTLAALAAAVLIGTQSSQAGAAALAAAQAGAVQMQIDFTRANELEADRVGIQTLADAGFDPMSMPGFFERLQTAMRYYGRPPEFLSTHPVTETRIAESRARAEQLPHRQRSDSERFRMVQAKLQVLSARDAVEVLRDFERILASDRREAHPAARYGRALALKRTGKAAQALEEVRALSRAYPDSAALTAERAQLEHANGNTARALEVFAAGLALSPGEPVLALGYAETLLEAGQPARAREVLLGYARNREVGPAYHQLLARSQERSGDLVGAHLSMAEYQYAMGRTALAVEQLTRARKRAGDDFYALARIDARLSELERELAESKARRR